MLADYHIHTKMCGHAEGELEEYILKARAVGLDEIGISDHIPMYFWPEEERDPTIAMSEEELPHYVKKVLDVQERFYPLAIKLGIEADYSSAHLPELQAILKNYPFDYVLGSIHFIDKWGFDNPRYINEYKNRDIDEVYGEYFNLLEQAAFCGQFDILAHPDLIKKLGFLPVKEISHIYKRLARIFAEVDLCIEINTSGMRAPIKEIFPAPAFLKECFKNKVPVSVGSDAHRPDFVGAGFKEARQLLQDIGYNQIAVFSQRKRRAVSL